MKTQLAIVGPTATGKTSLALELAEAIHNKKLSSQVHILSVDSRQVYKEIPILTGADIPIGFAAKKNNKYPYSYYQNNQIFLHGVGVIAVSEEWSVAQFREFYDELAGQIDKDAVLVLVGGTGLYHKSLQLDKSELSIPRNIDLRERMEESSVSKLQTELEKIDKKHFSKLNQSDRNNPRRLIRAIEKAEFLQKAGKVADDNKKTASRTLSFLKLAPLSQIEKKIKKRVQERLDAGVITEVEKVINTGKFSKQVMNTLGWQEINQYLDGKIDIKELKELWALHEYQYAKRQLTWWKKHDSWQQAELAVILETCFPFSSQNTQSP